MAGIVYAAQQWFDNNGNPLAGGELEFYEPGTSTPKIVYSDAAQTTSIGTSVTLDAAGRAQIFGVGSYKVIVKTSSGATVETRDGVEFETTIIGSFTSTIDNDDGSNAILGGADHTISGGGATNNAIVSGSGNGIIGSSTNCIINGGSINTIDDSSECVINGGQGSTIDGAQGSTCFGYSHLVTGDISVAFGNSAVVDKDYQIGHANNVIQTSQYVLSRATTDATPAEMFVNHTSGRLTIPSDTTWGFDIMVTARRTNADNESAFYRFEGCIDNNAGTTALVGSVVSATPVEDTAGWACAVTADNTNDALIITVTGAASSNITWGAFVRTVEITG